MRGQSNYLELVWDCVLLGPANAQTTILDVRVLCVDEFPF